MMQIISEATGVSRKYTNHCLRVTAIRVLTAQGVEDRDICNVCRLKNPGSLKPYCSGRGDEKRFSMSSKLHHGKPKTDLVPAPQYTASPKPSTWRGLLDIELDAVDFESAVAPAVTLTTGTAAYGPVVNTNTAIYNKSDTILQMPLFAGAHFQANCGQCLIFMAICELQLTVKTGFWLLQMTLFDPKYHGMKTCIIGIVWHFFRGWGEWCKCCGFVKVPWDNGSTVLFH